MAFTHKTNKLSQDLETKLGFLNSLSISPLADLETQPGPCDLESDFLFLSFRLAFNLIWLTIPTKRSSTLWFRTADVSMYLHSFIIQNSLPSENTKTKNKHKSMHTSYSKTCQSKIIKHRIETT